MKVDVSYKTEPIFNINAIYHECLYLYTYKKIDFFNSNIFFTNIIRLEFIKLTFVSFIQFFFQTRIVSDDAICSDLGNDNIMRSSVCAFVCLCVCVSFSALSLSLFFSQNSNCTTVTLRSRVNIIFQVFLKIFNKDSTKDL